MRLPGGVASRRRPAPRAGAATPRECRRGAAQHGPGHRRRPGRPRPGAALPRQGRLPRRHAPPAARKGCASLGELRPDGDHARRPDAGHGRLGGAGGAQGGSRRWRTSRSSCSRSSTTSNLGFALGASDYLTKPIDRERLVAVLNQLPAGRSPVLVVDDDPDAPRADPAHPGARRLDRVAEAENGRAALARIREHPPGLILLDLMMPEMDGFEFLAELRKQDDVADDPDHRHHGQGADARGSPAPYRLRGAHPPEGRREPRCAAPRSPRASCPPAWPVEGELSSGKDRS